MNSYDGSFFKYDNSARVCISDTDRLLMFYLVRLVLYCIALCCIVLHCVILYCIVLCCIIH